LLILCEMTLPGAERAVVDVAKLHSYCLNPAHPRGRHKARVFTSALRISQTDADWLKATLLNAALHGNAVEAEEDKYGKRYIVDFRCMKEERNAIVRSAWVVRRGEDFPRLITCYVLSE
jgi:hypothetical protein